MMLARKLIFLDSTDIFHGSDMLFHIFLTSPMRK